MTLTDKAASFARTETEEGTVGQWMPIESAPKDGTDVMLSALNMAWRPPSIAGWFGEPETDRPGWYSYDEPETLLRFTPTHWQPLPPPPSDAALGNAEVAR